MKLRQISGMRRLFYLAILSNCFLAIGFAIASAFSFPYNLPMSLSIGLFFGGHFFSPDLAFKQSLSSQCWGLLSHVWEPYRAWARSHLQTNNVFILGATIRLIYFYIFIQLVIGIIYALAINFGFRICNPEIVRKELLFVVRDRWLDLELGWIGLVLGCNPVALLMPFETLLKVVKKASNLLPFL